MNHAYSIPVRTQSEANLREHWAKRAKRAKAQRSLSEAVTRSMLRGKQITYPVVVTLIRVAGRFLDEDNNAGAEKHVQDGIADALGIDDGDRTKVRWRYDQRKWIHRAEGYKVLVIIEEV